MIHTYLISREEQQRVRIPGEFVHGCKDALKIDIIVRTLWICSIERVQWGVDIQCEIDASIREGVHALIVIGVGRVVNRIYTNGVDS